MPRARPPAAVPRSVRLALLALLALLAAPQAAGAAPAAGAPLRVECRASAGRLLAELDLSPAIDAGLEQRLDSGLASTVQLTVAVLDPSGATTAQAGRRFDVRLDVWTDAFSVTIREPDGTVTAPPTAGWGAVRALLAHPAAFDLGPLPALPERFTVEARLELDPVTGLQLEKTRRQLTHPAGARSLLGTLAGFLLRAPPPNAERLRSAPFARARFASP